MSEQADKRERQWGALLTRCYGESVEADAVFKSDLLEKLRRRTAENREESQFARLLGGAFRPSRPEPRFREELFKKLQSKQAELYGPEAPVEDDVFRTILATSYKPVDARREFQTRLLVNMKERQRTATTQRFKTRRRTAFLSALSGLAAAAAVALVIWTGPFSSVRPDGVPLNLPIPGESAASSVFPAPRLLPVAASFDAGGDDAAAVPALYAPADDAAASVFDYRVADAFQRAALPSTARGIRSVEYDAGEGWRGMVSDAFTPVASGMAFRTSEEAGHIGFDDGTIITMNPDSRVVATERGLSVEQGFLLVSVPASADRRFLLHFAERDIAVEPGTDLAVMVENAGNYAEGGAPAPLVMVVEDENGGGGLALARGRYGVGPLFAKHVYRLDKYVTPDMPGRIMCDTERQDLENFFKTETVRGLETPKALFAGGFGGAERGGSSLYTTVMTPAGFSKRGDAWVADSYRGGETVRIRYLSDDYFGLANSRRDLSRALALGGEVIIDGGDGVFYEIYR